MSTHVRITLEQRGVSCVARLLEQEAPRTCAAVLAALPLAAQVYHGKYARNEIYALFPQFAEQDPGAENTTVTPIPGDLCWFTFSGDDLGNPAYGYETEQEHRAQGAIVDLALFYGRNNLLVNGDQGWVPGNVFGTVVEGLEQMAHACQDLWMGGVRGESLRVEVVDGG
ncbi:DUF3830 family protein [Ornithinimicrobium sediminis]|uniref:DUF3830 family protein n=1 Tax=Ornithinimicrobium sediminis TaxID=2904603 RepID=UPI001E6306B6|nr:DUF3830 family protein [Ornithinimicrobium sediminis]MCE0486585.1 DUF3830 family protein [Ornithinimicrobium sediminis]